MPRNRATVFFLNAGHFVDHFFMLIFPTVVLSLEREWHQSYGTLLALGTAGFVAFAAGTLPAGWLGDRFNRTNMMIVFFLGLGGASILTGFAQGPLQLALGLTLIGAFASIYHPVGIAMVVEESAAMGKALGVNGVFGNLGVACAAISSAGLAAAYGWRAAFLVPGILCCALGVAFALHVRRHRSTAAARNAARPRRATVALPRAVMLRLIGALFVGSFAAGLVFNASIVMLPKLYAEQLRGIATDVTDIGWIATLTFTIAAFAQAVVGHVIDRYPVKPLYIALPLAQAPLLVLIMGAHDWSLLVLSLMLYAVVFGNVVNIDWMVGRYSTPEWRARVYAMRQLLSLGAGALTLPFVGFLHDLRGDFSLVLPVMTLCSLTVVVTGFFLPRERDLALPATATEGA